jgi:hypothetical protein
MEGKKYPTTLQQKALDNLVANGGTVTKAMRDAGYSENTVQTPSKLTESKGFKELCEQYGLTDNLLLSSLVEDIKKKEQNRKAELELGFKIKGRLTEKLDVESGGKPIQIYGGISIQGHDSNPEDIFPSQENTSGGGGDISE